MRSKIEEYKAVEEAAMKFVRSVAEGNSAYAKELFTDEAVLFGFLICAYYVVLFMLNDTVVNEEDVTKYLGLSVLASVPMREGEEQILKAAEKKKKSSGKSRSKSVKTSIFRKSDK